MGTFTDTRTLYYEDAYLKEVRAKVIEIIDGSLVLDQTIFYPEGGGQKDDFGTIEWDAHKIEIKKLGKSHGKLLHIPVEENLTLPQVGKTVKLKIDWNRRFAMTKIHTALHLLSAMIFEEYGVLVTGGDITPEKGKLDFDFDKNLSLEEREKIQNMVQKAIEDDLQVTSEFISREKAETIPDLIRTKVNLLPKGLIEIRTVKIGEIDYQADGGLHVKSTKELGTFKITKAKNKGKGRRRLEISLT